jgi:beta-ketoacyl-acyl-carrier-protein synthase II
MTSSTQRVVITGLGAVTPIGLDVPSAWAQLLAGCPGIGPITLFDSAPLAVKIAGEAWGFDPLAHLSAKEARRADRNVQFALAAAAEAMRTAGLEAGSVPDDEFGVMIGSGAAGIHTYTAQQKVMDTYGPGRISPLLIPMITVDAASVQVAIRYRARGPNVGLASACSTGLDAIGAAAEVLRRGDAQVMLAGGTEAAVTPLGIAGFDQMGALSRRNHDPRGASRPFDAARDGFVLAEGAGLVVLETMEHAQRRGAPIRAEVLAYASTTDAVHLTNPDLSGAGPARAITRALAKAGRAPGEVDLVSAHATGTPLGDPAEATALQHVFGERAAAIPIAATKSVTGHLLGAAGAVATIWTVLSLTTGLIPPTANLTCPDPRCALDHVRGQPRRADLHTALVTAFGFGGHNSVLVLGD